MKTRLAILAASVSLAAALPLLAHHSFAAEFDATKAIRVTGTLTKVEWTNPHTYFFIEVKEDNGSVSKWSCEAGSPGALTGTAVAAVLAQTQGASCCPPENTGPPIG